MAAKKPKETVETYMEQLEHPFKAEVEALRTIIKGVDPRISEQIKWNAPSYRIPKDYIATFNLRTPEHVHLIFHNPHIARIQSAILEGDYPDRRMTYFTSMEDVNAKRPELERVVSTLIAMMDA
jgi:hypothetical protein